MRTRLLTTTLVLLATGQTSAQEAVPVVEQAPPAPPAPYASPPVAAEPGLQVPPPTSPPRLQRIEYVDGMTMPPGSRLVSRRRLGILISGVAVFGVFYLGSVITWAISQDAAGCIQDSMLIPVVGPFLAIPDAVNKRRRVGAVFTGLAQTAGFILFVAGLFPRRYLEYYASLRVTPGISVADEGVALSARTSF